MSEFPDPIELPASYEIARNTRQKELSASIFRGMGIRIFIILAELVGFFVFGSYALLMDGLASTVDVLFSAILLVGIRMAVRPPDEEHPFGHGRYEPLAGLQLAVFLFVAGAFLAWEQFFSVIGSEGKETIHPFVWVIPVMAVLLLEGVYRYMMYYAKKNNSPALKADAAHYRVDAVNSLLAAIVLILGSFFPEYSERLDHFGAFLIAALMIGIGFNAARHNAQQLIDRKPGPKYFARVRRAALGVPGVKATEKIMIQISGPDAHVDIDIEVDPKMPVDEAHKIAQLVTASIQKEWPSVRQAMVHVEPYYPSDH